jgi:hypothetical protein
VDCFACLAARAEKNVASYVRVYRAPNPPPPLGPNPLPPPPPPNHHPPQYSLDACLSQFTPGQAARIAKQWTTYRAGR